MRRILSRIFNPNRSMTPKLKRNELNRYVVVDNQNSSNISPQMQKSDRYISAELQHMEPLHDLIIGFK